MYVRTDPVGTTYRNAPAYRYACDACTSVYMFPFPKDAPFRCTSPACGWSRVTIEGEQPFPKTRGRAESIDDNGMVVNLRLHPEAESHPFDHQSGPNGCPATCPACGWEAMQDARERGER